MARRPYPRVSLTSPQDLHDRLVRDAVSGVETPVKWALAAYARIGKARDVANPSRGAEVAFIAVEAEVHAAGRMMPGVVRA